MKSINQFLRLTFIYRILLRHGLDDIVLALPIFKPVRFIRFFSPTILKKELRLKPRGERIRQSLEDLGPLFVKFGQILSTRRDLLPDDLASELAKLQDQVPPFSSDAAIEIIEKSFGQNLTQIFRTFDKNPLASASIAQVHSAQLLDGQDVVVKVVRPGIDKTINKDISLLYFIASKLQKYWSEGKRLRPVEIVAEFEKNLIDELDLMKEASNATLLHRNFKDSPLLYVPKVDLDHCRKNVMIMERIYGIPVTDINQLKKSGVDLKKLSESGVEIFFTQVFRDNFFHADMHPGNIFVKPDGQYISIDFGIMGSLTREDQRYLAENLLAFFNRDYYRVAELHVESGWVPAETKINDFEATIRSVCEPIFDRPLHEISFGQLLLRLFQTARRYNMEIQPQLILLQKTLLNIEGLGRQLYPQLDLWVTAKPFLEKWMSEQVGMKAFFKELKHHAPMWMEQIPQAPTQLFHIVKQANAGKLEIKHQSEQLKKLEKQIKDNQDKQNYLIFGSSLIIAGAVIYSQSSSGMDIKLALSVGITGLLINLYHFIK